MAFYQQYTARSLQFWKELLYLIVAQFGDSFWFLGGSKRFGYDNDRSDLDLFFFVPTNHLHRFVSALRELYFHEVHDSEYLRNRLTVGTEQWMHFRRSGIDVLIAPSYHAFECLEKEHEMVQMYLEREPEVLNAIRSLKVVLEDGGEAFKGKYIYRALVLRASEQAKEEV